MKSHVSYVKVRYAETDQMGVVHHGNYAQYFEIARLEWLMAFGISYKNMEETGVMLPVYELQTKFLKPAVFEDELKIEVKLKELPSVKITFEYVIYNQNKELLTTGATTLVFMDAISKKPIRCPKYILDKLK
ncbi:MULTISPECIES: acyl-CoA thioesterase [Salegentibacter]|uniref:Acyl-CoA thioesterase n=1 Tax=Salegentibacter maritimus TaxID=2794347 RepID=A0ABS0THJ7_9FLAO|nr:MULTISPECIES: thioesterase family protein [Salegentibacter]MBE7641221.1 YbgC/FadM family acyl-CoA thioesterase [Salegentibacter sp. BLCTC]MBI6116445.1 acyl-CoA thioesterase [Salegentibacter maritimus]MBI6120265.1 acyl-CoA thioesterase [Salegentibacter maritimus]